MKLSVLMLEKIGQPDPQKEVNVPWIRNAHHRCSSKIPSENLTFSEIELILDRYK
jgi:hypothetical protein